MTVHFVDEGVDTGPILLQRPIELTYTRPVHEVTEEIHAIEHELLPRAIELIADGAVHVDPDNPRLVQDRGAMSAKPTIAANPAQRGASRSRCRSGGR